MIAEIKSDVLRVVILDISSLYCQIHNEGYFSPDQVEEIKQQYSDTRHWHVLVINNKLNIIL